MNVRSLRVSLLVVGVLLGALSLKSESLVLTPTPETEPNNTAPTATALTGVTSCQAASGSISPIGDLDYYSFSAPPGSRVWALVDTSASAASRDSVLTLFGPDGTTQIEMDDDDAPGTNCDATNETILSSTIAGRTLVTGGTYFLRVERAGGGALITSYRLLVVVSSSASPEVEANNTTATANPITTAGSLIGVRDAMILPLGDVDVYSVVVPVGSTTLFISADQDPDRNLSGTDVVVELIAPDGTTVLRSLDFTDSAGFPPPGAESFCFDIATAGTYFVRISGAATKSVTGPYSLMVAVCGVPVTPTPTATVTRTATLTATSIPGVATATPTLGAPTATPTATGTATATATRTSTPIGGIAPTDIPALSFPMLLLMAVGLVSTAYLLIRRA
jgi:hypothetical protein